MPSIDSRFLKLQGEISEAAIKAGRNPKDISLIAVSKGHSCSSIEAAVKLGQRDFGESYAGEFLAKFESLKDLNLKWHFIGGIQSNKINIIRHADVVHSIATLRHASLLDKATLKPIEVFLQVNLGSKEERSGFVPAEILQILAKPWPFQNLKFLGLMTILPLKPELPKHYWFSQMAQLKEQVLKLGLTKVELSMGMSGDFSEAIMHGANYIRVGTKIFGER